MSAFFRSHAFAIAASAVLLFAASLLIVGTDTTRDVLDISAMAAGIIVGMIYLLPAIDRFRQGAGPAEWRFIIGLVLFSFGWSALRGWAFAYRYFDRPSSMAESPVNAALVAWVLGGFLLIISASAPPLPTVPGTRIYYVAVGVLAGLLLGLAIPQMWGALRG
jgi:hypothetical protein